MKPNSVIHKTVIIRCQVEYSESTKSAIVRCILESPSDGQRRGFRDIETLLATLYADLIVFHDQILPLNSEKEER